MLPVKSSVECVREKVKVVKCVDKRRRVVGCVMEVVGLEKVKGFNSKV